MEPKYLQINKRRSNSNCTDEPDPKRRAFSSVMGEALKNDIFQIVSSVFKRQMDIFTKENMEPFLRKIVREEIETFTAKQGAQSGTQIRAERNLHLRIVCNLPKVLYAGEKVTGIHVSLHDSLTGELMAGPESSMTLSVVVLHGDFNLEENGSWTEEEFDSVVVGNREHKPPLIVGNLKVKMKEGVAEVGEFNFTDNSSWVKSKKFRLGIKVASGCGLRVREAVSDAFPVRSQRGALYMKHHPPLPKDEVWRLEMIRKGGDFHKRLNEAGILTVEQFVHRAAEDEKEMRSILLNMSDSQWRTLYIHAATCVLAQSGNGVFHLQQQRVSKIHRPLCSPQMNRTDEECSPYIGDAEESKRVDTHDILSCGAGGRALHEEDQSDNSFRIEDMDFYSMYPDFNDGEGCLNSFVNAPSYPCSGDCVPSCSSTKAVLGWMKVKAALQWGIFVRNRAAQRRVELTELHC